MRLTSLFKFQGTLAFCFLEFPSSFGFRASSVSDSPLPVAWYDYSRIFPFRLDLRVYTFFTRFMFYIIRWLQPWFFPCSRRPSATVFFSPRRCDDKIAAPKNTVAIVATVARQGFSDSSERNLSAGVCGKSPGNPKRVHWVYTFWTAALHLRQQMSSGRSFFALWFIKFLLCCL